MAIPVATASGEIRRGKLYLTDRAALDENLHTLKDGTPIELEVYQLRATRSSQQNRAYWGLVIKALVDHTGYTPSEIHELMKAKFLPKAYGIVKVDGTYCDEFTIGASTRTLTTDEFGRYMDEIRVWASEKLGLEIQQPNEHYTGMPV